VLFRTATEWVARLRDAKRQGSLEAELRRLSFIPLLVVDEVGYTPFDPEAANLMFSLVSSRYERASMIVTLQLAADPAVRGKRPDNRDASIDRDAGTGHESCVVTRQEHRDAGDVPDRALDSQWSNQTA
jgi:hypothetical protein